MTHTFTTEQVIALAPDAASAKAGRGQATPRLWQEMGADDNAVWGLCQGSAKLPYQTQIDLQEMAFQCSCPSRKFPCKHALGLFLLLVEQPQLFPRVGPPEWVTTWLEGRKRRAQKSVQAKESKAADTKAAAKRTAAREEKVGQGIAELTLWLKDLLRQGLATTRTQPRANWDKMAARLVDAQAPGLARLVREMASTVHAGDGWQDRLLAQMAQLHLLVDGYSHLDTLPPPLQADLRSQIGWTLNQEDLLQQEGVRDHWAVLGQRIEEERLATGSTALRVQRIWLQAESTQHPALLLHFAVANQPLEARFVSGTRMDAEFVFYPSAWPLRVLFKAQFAPSTRLNALPGTLPILQATAAYADALSAFPWLDRFPMALRGIVPYSEDAQWFLRDEDAHTLPLSPNFEQTWSLLAISGGHPIDCFGEWNGVHFLPLSVCTNQQWTFFA